MKVLIVISLVVLGLLAEGYRQLPCATDLDCRNEECCALRLGTANERMCTEKGDGIGELCGGDYLCPDCRAGLQCTNFSNNLVDQLTTADSSCNLPATGSCTQDGAMPAPVKSYTTAQLIKMSNSTRGKRSCLSDLDCTVKQCCAERFEGSGKVCRDIGDDYGDSCGGYFCNSCRKGLICVPTSQQSPALPRTDVIPQETMAAAAVSRLGELVAAFALSVVEPQEDSTCLPPANGTCRYPAFEQLLVTPVVNEASVVNFASEHDLCHIGFNTPCLNDSSCLPKECCATHFNGMYKVCKSKSGLGKPCGGEYFCATCKHDMDCISSYATFPEPAVNSASCALPANGTCQFSQSIIDLLYATDLLSLV